MSATDADAGDTFTYTLVSGTGDTDNASFTIDGATLKTAGVFDFETKSSYSVRVRVTDAGGLSFERAFTITVTDVNEAPTLTAITDRRVYNVSTSQVVNLAGITAGPETAQTTTTSVSTSNPTVFSAINIVGTQIQFTLAAGIATPQDVVVTVRVRDNGGVANGGVDSVVRTFRLGIDPMPVAAASPNLILGELICVSPVAVTTALTQLISVSVVALITVSAPLLIVNCAEWVNVIFPSLSITIESPFAFIISTELSGFIFTVVGPSVVV